MDRDKDKEKDVSGWNSGLIKSTPIAPFPFSLEWYRVEIPMERESQSEIRYLFFVFVLVFIILRFPASGLLLVYFSTPDSSQTFPWVHSASFSSPVSRVSDRNSISRWEGINAGERGERGKRKRKKKKKQRRQGKERLLRTHILQ